MLYWIWLTQIKGVGPKRQRLLLEKLIIKILQAEGPKSIGVLLFKMSIFLENFMFL